MKQTLKKFALEYISPVFRQIGPISKRVKPPKNDATYKVLVIGVVLANKENFFNHIVNVLGQSKHSVTQYWVSLFGSVTTTVSNVSIENFDSPMPRNEIINYVINRVDIYAYDYIIICDDDIKLPKGFLDSYLYIQHQLNFSIAQPARTNLSHISHGITRRRFWLIARKTLFVEIGPLVSFHQDIFKHIFPFDASNAMGWGLDYVWPVIVESLHKSMGIIDATPVDHSLRETAKSYSLEKAYKDLDVYQSHHQHYKRTEAQVNLKTYSSRDLYQ